MISTLYKVIYLKLRTKMQDDKNCDAPHGGNLVGINRSHPNNRLNSTKIYGKAQQRALDPPASINLRTK